MLLYRAVTRAPTGQYVPVTLGDSYAIVSSDNSLAESEKHCGKESYIRRDLGH